MRLHPTAAAALAMVAGITLSAQAQPPATPLLAAAMATGIALAWQTRRMGKVSLAGALAFFFLLGAGLHALSANKTLPPDHVFHAVAGHRQTLIGAIVKAPERTRHGWRLALEAQSVGKRPARGLVRLSLPPNPPPPGVGSLVRAKVVLKPFTGFANPGCFDYAAYMAAQGFRVRAYAGKASKLEVIGRVGKAGLGLRLEGARQELSLLLEGLEPGPGRALLRALILGQRGELEPSLRTAFSYVGAAHLLAISGLHLGMIWGLAFLAIRLGLALWPGLALRLPAPKIAAWGALLPCAAYAALAGGSTPTLRALIMALCVATALSLNRPYRPSGALGLAALAICLIWPEAPLTLSFQLSFTAVASILLMAGPLSRIFQGRGRAGRILAGLGAWLALTTAIALAVWPLSALNFHQVPLMTLPANAVLTPLTAALTLPPALLGAFTALLWPQAGLCLWGIASAPAGWASDIAQWLAGMDGAVLFVSGPGAAGAALLYAAALCLAFVRGKLRWAAGAAALGAALAAWALHVTPPPPDGRLTAWVLDVDQGSSTVIRLPEGQVLVVDGGGWPGGGLDFGRQVLAPFLWHQGFTRVKGLVCSHADTDHAAGLVFLARWFHPQWLWTNGTGPLPGEYGELLRAARSSGAPILPQARGGRAMEMGGAVVQVFWPPPHGMEGNSQNDRSLWLGVGLGQCWLWLPGDVGPKAEGLMAPCLPQGGRNLLLAPHHGGKGSCSPPLLARLKPKAVVFSAGCFNRFKLPRPKVLARVRASGARILSTAENGCIRLSTGGKKWNVRPWLEKPRFCGLCAAPKH